jgi:hypothetical protein
MDHMAMAQAMMAFQRQAAEQLAATKAALQAAGLGFSDDDRAAIAAAAAANPFPPGYDPNAAAAPEAVAQAQEMAQRAMEAAYPPDGFPEDDPRLAPVEGLTLPMLAIAAKAIGWAADDAALQDRVARALGLEPDVYRRASEEWGRRLADDIVLAAFYGQLFSQA